MKLCTEIQYFLRKIKKTITIVWAKQNCEEHAMWP